MNNKEKTTRELTLELEKLQERNDQLEATLQICKKQLQTLIHGIPMGFGIVEENRLQVASEYLCELTGFSQEELMQQDISVIFPNSDDIFGSVPIHDGSTNSRKTETPLRQKDGQHLEVQVNADCSESGKIAFFISELHGEQVSPKETNDGEALLKSLINGINESILMLDLEGNVLVINEEGARRNNTIPEEMQGKEVFSFMPPEVAKVRKRYFQHILRKRKAIRFTDRRPDGCVYNNLVYPIYNSSGELSRIAVIAQDITKQNKAEQELLEAKETLQALIDASPLPLMDLDLEGRVRSIWNRAAEETLGWTREEVLGRPLPTVQSEKQDEFDHLRSQVKNGESLIGVELHRVRKDGRSIVLHLYTAPLHNTQGEIIGIMSAMADVTEQKHAEKQLLKFKLGIERSGEAIFTTDPNGVIEYVNPAFTRIYGYGREEAIGHTPRVIKSGMHPQQFYHQYWEAILAKDIIEGEIVNKTKSGELITIQGSTNPILNEDNEIIGFLAIQRDVTEQKRLEEQYRQAQKMESIGRLAGGVAHDLNNLLTPILGYSELLLGKLLDNDSLLGYAQQIHHAAERSRDLTRQLLAFGRKQALKMRVINAAEGIARFEKILKRTIREDISLTFQYAPDTGSVRIDQSQIGQVLLNLAINAQDAMPNGGLLRIKTDNHDVVLRDIKKEADLSPGKYVVLSISDTGQGIAPEIRTHIFEPFFTTKKDGQGTGLGLSTVYGIVKQHNGHIVVVSEPGQGTTFRIYLPRVNPENNKPEIEMPVSHPMQGSGTILVVEDNDMVRSYVYTVLNEQGYQVLETADAQDALKIVEEQGNNLDLLISDVIMPTVNGRELYNQITALYPQIRVLYISGYTNDVIAKHGVLNEGVFFLQKPFSSQQLLKIVRDLLSCESRKE